MRQWLVIRCEFCLTKCRDVIRETRRALGGSSCKRVVQLLACCQLRSVENCPLGMCSRLSPPCQTVPRLIDLQSTRRKWWPLPMKCNASLKRIWSHFEVVRRGSREREGGREWPRTEDLHLGTGATSPGRIMCSQPGEETKRLGIFPRKKLKIPRNT